MLAPHFLCLDSSLLLKKVFHGLYSAICDPSSLGTFMCYLLLVPLSLLTVQTLVWASDCSSVAEASALCEKVGAASIKQLLLLCVPR